MERNQHERIAAIVVLATIVTVALIAAIAETAASTSRFLGVIGLLSLLGLLRHGYCLIRFQQSLLETVRTTDLLLAEQECSIRGKGLWFPVVTAKHEASFLRDNEDGI